MDAAPHLDPVDVLVSPDTALAHYAGAIGKPVGLMLEANRADWRWSVHGVHGRWFPEVSLHRQSAPHDWSSAVRQVGAWLVSLTDLS